MASLKTLLLGEDLAGLRKAKTRAERELGIANSAVVDAETAYSVALDDGESDEVMRAALDLKNTTGWQVSRLSKKIAALNAQIANLEEKAHAERLKKCMREAVEAASAHGKAAAAANATYWANSRARAAMMQHNFARELTAIEPPPIMVADHSNQFSADPDSGAHDALDRWRWGIEQLRQSLETQP